MSFLEDKCSLFPLTEPEEIEGFTCGDQDLDEFFTNDCFAYTKELLGKTYCFKTDENPRKVVCAFTLANAGIRVNSTEQQEKCYRQLKLGAASNTRLMYYDLMMTANDL